MKKQLPLLLQPYVIFYILSSYVITLLLSFLISYALHPFEIILRDSPHTFLNQGLAAEGISAWSSKIQLIDYFMIGTVIFLSIFLQSTLRIATLHAIRNQRNDFHLCLKSLFLTIKLWVLRLVLWPSIGLGFAATLLPLLVIHFLKGNMNIRTHDLAMLLALVFPIAFCSVALLLNDISYGLIISYPNENIWMIFKKIYFSVRLKPVLFTTLIYLLVFSAKAGAAIFAMISDHDMFRISIISGEMLILATSFLHVWWLNHLMNSMHKLRPESESQELLLTESIAQTR